MRIIDKQHTHFDDTDCKLMDLNWITPDEQLKIINSVVGKDLLTLHEKKLCRILEVVLSEGCDTVILGAFGCGAFQNNPEVVALANKNVNKNVIKDYLHAFKNIEFAVYCSPRDDRNFKIFERVLKPYCK